MDERDWLADRFQAHRPRLRAVAYRMLGSLSEADDAVQEAWLHVSPRRHGQRHQFRRMADDAGGARVP
jgi:DNA-directed RNA polymerase specialized sigma24 family protein